MVRQVMSQVSLSITIGMESDTCDITCQGECNREIPPGETPVRVERCGKSAPAAWRLCRHVNPIRCKMRRLKGCPPAFAVSLERVGDDARR